MSRFLLLLNLSVLVTASLAAIWGLTDTLFQENEPIAIAFERATISLLVLVFSFTHMFLLTRKNYAPLLIVYSTGYIAIVLAGWAFLRSVFKDPTLLTYLLALAVPLAGLVHFYVASRIKNRTAA